LQNKIRTIWKNEINNVTLMEQAVKTNALEANLTDPTPLNINLELASHCFP
jgi:hypothetical protein